MIWNEMDSRLKAKPQPRLGRLNAHKNIDYDPASSSSSSCSTPSSSISLRNLTSFRIQGDVGEMDRICFTLGLSGPDDFSIPFDAWQARKAKPLWLQDDQPEIKEEPVDAKDTDDVSIVIKSGREQEYVEHSKVLLTPIISNSQLHDTPRVSIIEDPLDKSGGEQEYADPSGRKQVEQVQISNSDRQGGGGGINGVRPPLLVPPSPLDNGQGHSPSSGNTTSSSRSSSTVDGIGPRLGETTPLSEPSSSSSTSNDSDHNDGGAGSDGDGDDGGGGGGVRSTTDTHPIIISSNLSFKRDIKSWTKGVLLGSGSFGTVYEGFSNDGFFFAVKEVSLLDQGKQAKQSIYQLEQEISLLSQFEHENIVQYLGTDKDAEKLYIFLELVTKGSLAQLYHKYRLRDSQVSAYTRQILHGLKYLHDRNVVHRDIKCANILVDEKGYVKLADFGLAKATKLNDVKSCKGTAFWMAPEVVNRRSRGYGLAADIWSLGCTVLEMLTRELPYSHLECMQALFKIGRGEPPPISNSLSTKARDFIQQCLQVKADDRPTASQLLEHPFVNRPLSVSSGNGSPSQPKRTRS